MGADSLWTTVNGVLAGWNYTRLFNPAWSSHAKYHDALSIIAGIVLGLVALVYLWRGGARIRKSCRRSAACTSARCFSASLRSSSSVSDLRSRGGAAGGRRCES